MRRPAILITIDTEGDNLWSRGRRITTRNSEFVERFQLLCERYSLRPTYLTNWEMVHCPVFQEFARDALERGTAEIGMHLHAFNNPPLSPITDDDQRWFPYLIEYPENVMRAKIETITEAIEGTFGVRPVSHRAGRWALDETYARILADNGYLVDCSVTPHVSWRSHLGDPRGRGGVDYTEFPETAYRLDLEAIDRPGDSTLLEIPTTIMKRDWPPPVEGIRRRAQRWSLPRRAMAKLFPSHKWFRPNGRNRREMLEILDAALVRQWDYVQMALHSSELMPGGSPTFPTAEHIESLYGDLEAVFKASAGRFEGLTLEAYCHRFSAAHVDHEALGGRVR